MKSALLCILGCVLLPACLYSQPTQYPDSIRVELPELHSVLVINVRDFARDQDVLRTFPSRVAALAKHMRSSTTADDHTRPKRVLVRYSDAKDKSGEYQITITDPVPPTTSVSVKNNTIVELLPPGWEVRVEGPRFKAFVYAPDLERLEQVGGHSLEPVLKQLNDDPATSNQTRMGFTARVILDNGTVTADKITHRGVHDMLELAAGAGVGLVQDRFYPEVNLFSALRLSNRYKSDAQRFQFSWDFKLFSRRDQEGGFEYTPASFLNLSWSLNFAKERPRWTGIGAGYMLYNKSDVFTGKTLRLFLDGDIGSTKLNLVPELYLTDDFKRALFGLKLSYKF